LHPKQGINPVLILNSVISLYWENIYKKGRGQKAEGRRKEVLIKTLVMGLKPS